MRNWSDGHSHTATCPYCKEQWDDLWEYPWHENHTLKIECQYCDEKLLLMAEFDVTYYTAKLEQETE